MKKWIEIIGNVKRTCEVNRVRNRERRREKIQVADPTYMGWRQRRKTFISYS